LIRPSRNEFGSPIMFVRKAYTVHYDYALTTVDLTRLRVRTPKVTRKVDELKDANLYTQHLDLVSGLWQVRVREEDVHKTSFHIYLMV
jgi:hypothetical protein